MITYTLQRTALPDLTFAGKQLAESIGTDADGSTQGRAHSIAVYETDDGELIVSVHFNSPFESELSDRIVEAVRSADEVEEVLSLYDATARLDANLFRSEPNQPKKQSVAVALQQRFDRQVLEVLKSSQLQHAIG